jgi:hypothetical protein
MPDSREADAAGSTQSPDEAPAVIVHGIMQAKAAVRTADTARGLVLLSAPGAGIYAGAGWFNALCRQAAATRPELSVRAMLDCGDAPGAVLGALRAGLPAIIFTGEATIAARLGRLAADRSARLLTSAPAALDMAGFRAKDTRWQLRLAAWLGPGAG